VNSLDALREVCGGELSDRARRGARKDASRTLELISDVLRAHPPTAGEEIRRQAHETVLFDPLGMRWVEQSHIQGLDVLLYAHRAVMLDPVAHWLRGSQAVDAPLDAAKVLDSLFWVAPLVEKNVITLNPAVGFTNPTAAEGAHGYRGLMLDIPFPIRGEYHWEEFRPVLVERYGTDPGEALDAAWLNVAHQLDAYLTSGGAFDLLLRSELERTLFYVGAPPLLEKLMPAPATSDAPAANPAIELLNQLVPSFSRVSPADIVAIRSGEAFQQWHDDLTEALLAYDQAKRTPGFAKEARPQFQNKMRRSGAAIVESSTRSRTLQPLLTGWKTFALSTVAGLTLSYGVAAVTGVAPPDLLAPATEAFGVAAASAPAAAKLLRAQKRGELAAQKAAQAHYGLVVTVADAAGPTAT
jgi:hypothetical protein